MLYATNRFPGDGTTTQYEISFVGGYLDRTHVKAYIEGADLTQTPVTINPANFLGPYTIKGFPVVPVGSTLVIYRDTPKAPIVDFVNGSRFTESNLDTATRQGLHVAAEAGDRAEQGVAGGGGGGVAGVSSFNGRVGAVAPTAGDYTPALVGLGNVDNTSDANKPVSTAVGAVLAGKAPLTGAGASGTWPIDVSGTAATATKLAYPRTINGVAFDGSADIAIPVGGGGGGVAGVSSFNGRVGAVAPTAGDYTPALVGLGNVNNTSDANKPVSMAQATALAVKASLNSPAFTGTPTGITKAHVGLSNVDNISAATLRMMLVKSHTSGALALTSGDSGGVVVVNAVGATSVTLPIAASDGVCVTVVARTATTVQAGDGSTFYRLPGGAASSSLALPVGTTLTAVSAGGVWYATSSGV